MTPASRAPRKDFLPVHLFSTSHLVCIRSGLRIFKTMLIQAVISIPPLKDDIAKYLIRLKGRHLLNVCRREHIIAVPSIVRARERLKLMPGLLEIGCRPVCASLLDRWTSCSLNFGG
ncbi:uncharacterized protein LOC143185004 isoform X2 [Calliopsis andreniformis]|uniref:uncharacterized protein LOC143185004 isoform X2 n=1 Tax=Calliopsis andreniformis TaxID=337506 RepID=UPI003FCE59C7